ncbi:MAG TPA: hypothetical protein H9819_01160 [Candidatus Bacteroides merdipullorum]|uniref:Uncharacterized protein n=1 Tax=Candidatus Bacteroides merdipullorum TaxID=2838474 RepID=A0A9D2CWI5_9BACE|nr:hypothetical protein [Candidatus Bacteroides merdipullorum]
MPNSPQKHTGGSMKKTLAPSTGNDTAIDSQRWRHRQAMMASSATVTAR